MYSRMSNAFIIGMIVGMLGFDYISDRLGRKSGAILIKSILVVRVALSAAPNWKHELGMFRMLVISNGIAGVRAGGEYTVTGTGATEDTAEDSGVRQHQGYIYA